MLLVVRYGIILMLYRVSRTKGVLWHRNDKIIGTGYYEMVNIKKVPADMNTGI